MQEVARDYARWGRPLEVTVAEFLALDRLPDGLVTIASDDRRVELPILVHNRRAAASFVGFHAAMNPKLRRPLPFLQGRGVAPRSLNTLLLGDPSLYLHDAVRVGWFLGNRSMALTELLPAILDHADRLMGARARLLWGCSAGGTAALRYAREQDTAVAINPQTIVHRFTRGRWQPWLEHGWGITERAEEAPFLAAHADLTTAPIAPGRVVYVQNVRDDHLATHMAPFAAAHGMPIVAGDHGRFRIELDDWGDGHTPPPAAWQKGLLADEAERRLGTAAGPWAAIRHRLRGWLHKR